MHSGVLVTRSVTSVSSRMHTSDTSLARRRDEARHVDDLSPSPPLSLPPLSLSCLQPSFNYPSRNVDPGLAPEARSRRSFFSLSRESTFRWSRRDATSRLPSTSARSVPWRCTRVQRARARAQRETVGQQRREGRRALLNGAERERYIAAARRTVRLSLASTRIPSVVDWHTLRNKDDRREVGDIPCRGTWAPRSGRPSSRSGRTSCSFSSFRRYVAYPLPLLLLLLLLLFTLSLFLCVSLSLSLSLCFRLLFYARMCAHEPYIPVPRSRDTER